MDWKNKPHQIFNKVKQQMFAKGVQSFHFIDQFITQFDPNNSKILSTHFFNLFLNKVGVFLTTQQIRTIRDLYSRNREQDEILYRDFLEDVMYSISEKIANLISQGFTKLDKNNEGSISFQYIMLMYDNHQHPHVLTRIKSPEQVKQQFQKSIKRKLDVHDKISRQSFVDYYAELNFCMPEQKITFFQELITNTWDLKKPETYVSQKHLQRLQSILFEKIREKSDGKINEWKAGKKALLYFGLADAKIIGYEEFKKGLEKFGCTFKQFQLKALFDKYSEGGYLDYEQFSKKIMEIDISGMVKQPNLMQTKMGKNYFKVTH